MSLFLFFIFFILSVDNFEMTLKTCSVLVWGTASLIRGTSFDTRVAEKTGLNVKLCSLSLVWPRPHLTLPVCMYLPIIFAI